MNNQEIPLVTFLDIEEEFYNTPFESMIIASRSNGVEDTILKRMEAILEERLIQISLAG